MDLYFFRHGNAEKCPGGGCDCDRHLTENGRQMIRSVAEQVRQDAISLKMIFSSPLVRAQETARIIADTLGWQGEVTTTLAVLPSGYPEEFCGELAQELTEGAYLFVGHQPFLGCMVAWLAEKSREETILSQGCGYHMHTSELKKGAGTIVRFIQPAV